MYIYIFFLFFEFNCLKSQNSPLRSCSFAAARLLLPFVMKPSCLHQLLYLVAWEPEGKGVLEKCALRRREQKQTKRATGRENADDDTDRAIKIVREEKQRWVTALKWVIQWRRHQMALDSLPSWVITRVILTKIIPWKNSLTKIKHCLVPGVKIKTIHPFLRHLFHLLGCSSHKAQTIMYIHTKITWLGTIGVQVL